jgi:hypothetical protein
MSAQARIEACLNLASGFLISARLAFLAGDHDTQARMEATAAAYEREADRIMMAENAIRLPHVCA